MIGIRKPGKERKGRGLEQKGRHQQTDQRQHDLRIDPGRSFSDCSEDEMAGCPIELSDRQQQQCPDQVECKGLRDGIELTQGAPVREKAEGTEQRNLEPDIKIKKVGSQKSGYRRCRSSKHLALWYDSA